jgi:uncharacterized membrane-anchored protein YhcB (DUF1043 family)
MNKEIEGTNSVDLAIEQLRKLQRSIYDYGKNQHDLFKETNEIIKTMQDAHKEINTNYAEISKQLTDLMNGKTRKKTNDTN